MYLIGFILWICVYFFYKIKECDWFFEIVYYFISVVVGYRKRGKVFDCDWKIVLMKMNVLNGCVLRIFFLFMVVKCGLCI